MVFIDCLFDLDMYQGEIRSPYYPDAYGDNRKCQWKLTTPPNYIAQFLLFRVRLDHGDYLQVRSSRSSNNKRISNLEIN